MKRNTLLFIAAAAVLVATFAIYRASQHEDEEKVVTEVAVQVGKVTKGDLHAHVEAYGVVQPEPAQAGRSGGGAKLAAPAAGVVLAVPASEGESVKAGDVIVRLDDRMARAAVDKAQNAVTYSQQLFQRQQELLKIEGTSEKAVQEASQQLVAARAELASAQGALGQVQLASPVDGIVARINVEPGQTVDPNMVIAEIVDLNRLIATVNVPAVEASSVQGGQVVEVFTDPDKPAVHGNVVFVSPSIDAKTDAVLVRVGLPKVSGLRPGQFVHVRIASTEHKGSLAVPRASLVKTEDGSVIYLVTGGRAVQRPVRAGVHDGDLVEIEAPGVKEGDSVVTVGAYGLPKETKVKIVAP